MSCTGPPLGEAWRERSGGLGLGMDENKCDDCPEPATVHVSRVVEGSKQEMHLCRACAEKRKLILVDQKLNLPAVAKNMAASVQVVPSDLAKMECPDCGTKYMEFRKTGRLGCPYDYVAFRHGLLPLIERVHRASRHTGKRPRRLRDVVENRGEIRALRFQLRQAVEAEDFEQAARIRDLIRKREQAHGP
ncbi:MAG: UvrB/UvrC motif-containing protein [Planctomycetota bacterium]